MKIKNKKRRHFEQYNEYLYILILEVPNEETVNLVRIKSIKLHYGVFKELE